MVSMPTTAAQRISARFAFRCVSASSCDHVVTYSAPLANARWIARILAVCAARLCNEPHRNRNPVVVRDDTRVVRQPCLESFDVRLRPFGNVGERFNAELFEMTGDVLVDPREQLQIS